MARMEPSLLMDRSFGDLDDRDIRLDVKRSRGVRGLLRYLIDSALESIDFMGLIICDNVKHMLQSPSFFALPSSIPNCQAGTAIPVFSNHFHHLDYLPT